MFPVIFDFHGIEIRSYPFFLGLGFLSGSLVAFFFLKIKLKCFWKAYFISLFGFLLGFFGSKISQGIFSSQVQLNFSEGGEFSFGVVILSILYAIFVRIIFKINLGFLLDAFFLAYPIAEGFARLGCLGIGCCHGPLFDGPFSIRFPKIFNLDNEIVGSVCYLDHLKLGYVSLNDSFSQEVFPVQIVNAALMFLLFFFSAFYAQRKTAPWFCFCFVGFFYGVIRFFIQFFRPGYDAEEIWEIFNSGHFFSIFLILSCGLTWNFLRRKKNYEGT